jgi:hypothetical protein
MMSIMMRTMNSAQNEAYKQKLISDHFGQFVLADPSPLSKRLKVRQEVQSEPTHRARSVRFGLQDNVIHASSSSRDDFANAWMTEQEEERCKYDAIASIQSERRQDSGQSSCDDLRGLELYATDASTRQDRMQRVRRIRQAILLVGNLSGLENGRETAAWLSVRLSDPYVKEAAEAAWQDWIAAMGVHFPPFQEYLRPVRDRTLGVSASTGLDSWTGFGTKPSRDFNERYSLFSRRKRKRIENILNQIDVHLTAP